MAEDPEGSLEAESQPDTHDQAGLGYSVARWSVYHAYGAFYLDPFGDLDAVAAALVRSRVVSCAYVSDGEAFWVGEDASVRSATPGLDWRQHQDTAGIRLPDGVQGWPAECMYQSLVHRFAEKVVLAPHAGVLEQYVRAQIEPFRVRTAEVRLTLYPTLKIYRSGVMTLTFRVESPSEPVSMDVFVEQYVNLFRHWSAEVWVPKALVLWSPELARARSRRSRLLRALVERLTTRTDMGDFEFDLFPAHVGVAAIVDDLGAWMEATKEVGVAGAKSDEAAAPFAASQQDGLESVPGPLCVDAAGEDGDAAPTNDESGATENADEVGAVPLHEPGEAAATSHQEPPGEAGAASHEPERPRPRATSAATTGCATRREVPVQNFVMSDLFENARVAIREALERTMPGRGFGRRYRLRDGAHWMGRPHVHLHSTAPSVVSKQDLVEVYGDQLGKVLARATSLSGAKAREALGPDLRTFDDFAVFVNKAVRLTVYRRGEAVPQADPNLTVLNAQREVLDEAAEYCLLSLRQLEEQARVTTSTSEARAVRTRLLGVMRLRESAFYSGELVEALRTYWSRLELGQLQDSVLAELTLAVEQAAELTALRNQRVGTALSAIFGVVGVTGLTDAVVQPLWTYWELPQPPTLLQQPTYFLVATSIVLLIVFVVTRVTR